jgi:cytochrome c oxidase subunit III
MSAITSAPSVEPSAFDTSWQKLMMWVFIVVDGLLFAGFLASYGFTRMASHRWPPQGEIFHLSFIALMTFILISSSVTMASAVHAARQGARGATLAFLWLTVLGGLAFLGMQAYEWSTLIHEGVRLSSNPWGVPLFGAYFFVITGFHGTHVLSGVTILAITAFRWRAGISTPEGVELAGLYWHFVDLVWIFIFTVFYLI